MKHLWLYLLFSGSVAYAQSDELRCGGTKTSNVLDSEKELSACGVLANYRLDKTSSYLYSPVYTPKIQIHVYQYSASDPRNYAVSDLVMIQQVMDWINAIYENLSPPVLPVLPSSEEDTDTRIQFHFLPVIFEVNPTKWDGYTVTTSPPMTILSYTGANQITVSGTTSLTPIDAITISGSPGNDGSYKVTSMTTSGANTLITISGAFPSSAVGGTAKLVKPLTDNAFSSSHFSSDPSVFHIYLMGQSHPTSPGTGVSFGDHINHRSFNTQNPLAQYALAQLLAHELGHSLGLYHTADCNPCSGCSNNAIVNPSAGITDLPPVDCSAFAPCDASSTISNNVMGYNQCRNYFSPLQIAKMRNYLNSSSTVISRLKECSYDATRTITISGSVTWNNREVVGGDIIIPSGSTLTIQCQVNMAEGSVIKVHPGGKLILDGGKLTNLCGSWWQGIEAIGNPSSTQTPVNQSTVIVKNGAVIENAYVAIRGGEVDPALVTKFNQGGAIIQAIGSTFRNNWWGIQFTPSTVVNNSSYVSDCHFINDAPLTNPGHSEPNAGITIWDTKGVEIKGCRFESTRSGLSENLRGTGIRLADAHNTVVLPYCTTSMVIPCPSVSTVKNEFINQFIGIETIAGSGTDQLTVDNSVFTNCVYGIKSSGSASIRVTRSRFEIPFATGVLWPGASAPYSDAFGMFIEGNMGLYAEENVLTPYQNGGSFQNVGIMINNSSSAGTGGTIYRNDFGDVAQPVTVRGLTIGIQTQGNNVTLPIDCNRFYEGNLTTKIDIHWASGTLANQGVCHATDVLAPQANEFYGGCTSLSTDAQLWKNTLSTSGSALYNSYPGIGYNDICNNWGTASTVCAITPAYDRNLACPSTLTGGAIKINLSDEEPTEASLHTSMAKNSEMTSIFSDPVYKPAVRIETESNNSSFQVSDVRLICFPNPSTGEVTIVLENTEAGKLTVTNLLGEIIQSLDVPDPYSQLRLGGLSVGVYQLSFIRSDKVLARQQLVISNM